MDVKLFECFLGQHKWAKHVVSVWGNPSCGDCGWIEQCRNCKCYRETIIEYNSRETKIEIRDTLRKPIVS